MRLLNLYDSNGYVNIPAIRAEGYPFILIWGGRGTGKTYGVIDSVINSGEKMIFCRRTQAVADTLFTEALNPFKKWNSDHGRHYSFAAAAKGVQGIYRFEKNGEGLKPVGAPIGYTAALSTFSHIRGIDGSDIDLIFLDEFIRERGEKGGAVASSFFDAYESIARNRELEGAPPLQFIGCSNAYDILNDFFVELKIVHDAFDMQRKNLAVKKIPERRLMLVRLKDSPISAAKADTALYKLAAGTAYGEIALENQFPITDYKIASRRLNEYIPLFSLGEVCVYIHKNRPEFYASPHVSGAALRLRQTDDDFATFRYRFKSMLEEAFFKKRIVYEDYITAALLSRLVQKGRF